MAKKRHPPPPPPRGGAVGAAATVAGASAYNTAAGTGIDPTLLAQLQQVADQQNGVAGANAISGNPGNVGTSTWLAQGGSLGQGSGSTAVTGSTGTVNDAGVVTPPDGTVSGTSTGGGTGAGSGTTTTPPPPLDLKALFEADPRYIRAKTQWDADRRAAENKFGFVKNSDGTYRAATEAENPYGATVDIMHTLTRGIHDTQDEANARGLLYSGAQVARTGAVGNQYQRNLHDNEQNFQGTMGLINGQENTLFNQIFPDLVKTAPAGSASTGTGSGTGSTGTTNTPPPPPPPPNGAGSGGPNGSTLVPPPPPPNGGLTTGLDGSSTFVPPPPPPPPNGGITDTQMGNAGQFGPGGGPTGPGGGFTPPPFGTTMRRPVTSAVRSL